MMQSPIIAVSNQKGGVGKTTTCVNVSACLASLGYRVLMIDLDPQGNATTACAVAQNKLQYSVKDWFTENKEYAQSILHNKTHGFDFVGANRTLASFFGESGYEVYYQIFKKNIFQTAPHYDVVLIDCAPSFGAFTWSALLAATDLLVPMQCEYYPLEGLSSIVATVKQINQSMNVGLKIVGIVRTMFDKRSRLSREVSEQLIDYFGDVVFQTVIPRNVRLAEAPSHGKTALEYDPRCLGSLAYMALTLELVRKMHLTLNTANRIYEK